VNIVLALTGKKTKKPFTNTTGEFCLNFQGQVEM
jgi:hypothetical protein